MDDNLTSYGIQIPYGLVARIPGFHPGGSGSIPGMGKIFFFLYLHKYSFLFVPTAVGTLKIYILIFYHMFHSNYFSIDYFYSSNIDVRIQQAELEYRLGREELELLTLREESRALQAALELAETQEKQKNDTIFRYLSYKLTKRIEKYHPC